MFIIFVKVNKKTLNLIPTIMKKLLTIMAFGLLAINANAQDIIPPPAQPNDSIQKTEVVKLEKEKAEKEALKAKEKAEKDATKEKEKAEKAVRDQQKEIEKEREALTKELKASEKARKEAEKDRKKLEKERAQLTDARNKVADLKEDLLKNKEKLEDEKKDFEKDKKRGKLSPNDEIKRQGKIDKLLDKNIELQNKLEKATIKLDKIR